MKKIIKEKILENKSTRAVYDNLKTFYFKYLISDERFLRKRFKKRLDRELELDNPVRYNDKLQWLKLNWYDPIATKCADKYEVRQIIEQKIGSKYLNELIAVYESVDEIDIDKLPEKFVLKGTHGSGFNIICTDKAKMNWDEEFRKMKRWFRTNYYWHNREWVYKDIKPRIICEKYLEGEDGNPPKDYKVFCFNGEPKIIEVDSNRFTSHTRNFYDTEWNFIELTNNKKPNNADQLDEKPSCLNELLYLSRQLSCSFPHVRVDFYIVEGKLIFGELTFWHVSGMGEFQPEEFEIIMGNWLKLPK